MKIVDQARKPNLVTFGVLQRGDCFRFADQYWIKSGVVNNFDTSKATQLHTGDIYLFDDRCEVEPILDVAVVVNLSKGGAA